MNAIATEDRPRGVWRNNGGMVVIRQLDDGEIEELEVPAWAAQYIFRLGERELVSDAQREAFGAAYEKRINAAELLGVVALLRALVDEHENITGACPAHEAAVSFLEGTGFPEKART